MTDEHDSDLTPGTPEGHTPEKPAPDELGEPGTPGAAAADPLIYTAHHDPVTHMDAHAAISDDDHGHAEQALGPIDWGAWLYALVGVIVGLIVVAAFWIALN